MLMHTNEMLKKRLSIANTKETRALLYSICLTLLVTCMYM